MKKTKEQNTKKQIPKTNHGITLIALVITIIVMLILVAVTVTMAVNGGLFRHAQTAAIETNRVMAEEQELGNGKINIAGKWYNSPQEYVDTLTGKTTTDTDNCELCQGDGLCIQWVCPGVEGEHITANAPREAYRVGYNCLACSDSEHRKFQLVYNIRRPYVLYQLWGQ